MFPNDNHYRQPRDSQRPPARNPPIQNPAPPPHMPPRAAGGYQQPPYDNQRQRQDTVDSSHRQQPHDIQRASHDTASGNQWQPYNNQQQRRDPVDSSRQIQHYDVQSAPRDGASSDQRQLYGTQRPPRVTTEPSHQRQPSDAQRSFDDTSGGGYHGQQGGAHGMDLTGRVRILPYPGKNFQWNISTGAFADVFMGEYLAPGMVDARPISVAVKIFRSTGDEREREAVSRRLIRESRVWLRLGHPNIQPYFGHCSDLALSVALISPLCENSTVMIYIVKNPSANKLQLIKEVAEGLTYLHSENVIHGDLQCNNVLVDDTGHAVLTDFGRAKVIGELGYSTQLLAGSAAYMAPELLSPDDVDVDELFSKNSDVYAFGMLCFKIFTNQEPFASYNVRYDMQLLTLIQRGKKPVCTGDVRRHIPSNMLRIMEACWMTTPASRPSAQQIVQRIP